MNRTTSARAGIAAPLVAFLGIGGAALATPGFSPTANALSDLGVAGPLAAALFGGGLVLAGLLSLAFVPALWAAAGSRPHRLRTGLFALDAVALSMVGVFPEGTPQHVPAAVAFYRRSRPSASGLDPEAVYLLSTLALWSDGAAEALAGRPREALLSAGLGTATVAAWVAWAATGPVFRPGLALPETVGAAALGYWSFRRARACLDRFGPSA
ncbi:MAG: DUF998 domain-containing protein [Haloarculaceae archaeon]